MDMLLGILHIVTAVFIVGPMAIFPMTAMRAARVRNGAQVLALAKATSAFSLLSLVVLFLGFAVLGVSDPKENWSLASAWILWSVVLYVVALAVNLIVTVPAMNRVTDGLTALTGTDGTASSSLPAGYAAIAAGSGVASLMLVAVVVLMVWKP